MLRNAPFSAAALLFAAVPQGAQIVSQDRGAVVSAFLLDAVFGEDPVTSADAESSLLTGPFSADLDASVSGLGGANFARADQDSDVDPVGGTFQAEGNAAASLYVQGQGDAEAESRFALGLLLAAPGSLVLDADLSVGDSFEGQSSHDPHATASVVLRVATDPGGAVLFERTALLGAPVCLAGEAVALPAGRYRFEVVARAEDETEVSPEEVDARLAESDEDDAEVTEDDTASDAADKAADEEE